MRYRLHLESQRRQKAAFHLDAAGQYRGTLKVVRTIDRKLLFPFPGCSVIGPFRSGPEARAASEALGAEIVAADIAVPEQ